ncbi:hypothetical protein E2C01_062631 [Portunus trituberculatus]|uniref:Uncharacterized protein n=1 Tax=Portunus trituberculatus TaxID=210409 RepID=A0A5B7HF69_PORTR|nr:hypothetical protein [Portunus trituberculatus]
MVQRAPPPHRTALLPAHPLLRCILFRPFQKLFTTDVYQTSAAALKPRRRSLSGSSPDFRVPVAGNGNPRNKTVLDHKDRGGCTVAQGSEIQE